MEDYPDFHGDHAIYHSKKIELCKCVNNDECKCGKKIIISANFPDNTIPTSNSNGQFCK